MPVQRRIRKLDARQRGQEEGHGCRLAAKLIMLEARMLILAAILLKLEAILNDEHGTYELLKIMTNN